MLITTNLFLSSITKGEENAGQCLPFDDTHQLLLIVSSVGLEGSSICQHPSQLTRSGKCNCIITTSYGLSSNKHIWNSSPTSHCRKSILDCVPIAFLVELDNDHFCPSLLQSLLSIGAVWAVSFREHDARVRTDSLVDEILHGLSVFVSGMGMMGIV
mmetsp:Transcript_30718/g.49994  ORF Transcript_30718/g.49994 Transcript_30718/m.49994 type:complete len:157 (-) Transcript_30718:27-497(-)